MRPYGISESSERSGSSERYQRSGQQRAATDHFSRFPHLSARFAEAVSANLADRCGKQLLRTTSRRFPHLSTTTPETSWQQGSASFTGVGEAVGVGVVGVVGGCEHTALSASAFGIHSATYNSCNSVAGKRQAER